MSAAATNIREGAAVTNPPAASRDGVSDAYAPAVNSAAPATSRKLLLVDDDAILARATARVLRDLGWDVTVATEPTSPIGYSVALVDWSPFGPEMLRRCADKQIAAVVYTGSPAEVTERVAVVAKPANPDELDAVLSAAVGVRDV
jgi:CheY-like chemotaxis protein